MITDKKLEYYREKYSEIGGIIQRLEICYDYREALLEAIDGKLPAFMENSSNLRSLSEPVPMSKDLAHKVRIMMIEELHEEIKNLRNTLDEML